MRKKIKECWNCKARMEWNEKEMRWECKLCGYAEAFTGEQENPPYIG